MDEELTAIPTEEETQPEETIVRNFATVGAVYTDGVSLIFDGESEPTQKHYLCNTMMYCRPGDRVKIVEDSGTYVVEYVVGAPLQTELRGLPTGGVANQILTKMSDKEFDAAWQTLKGLLPSGGTAGQVLTKSNANDYAVGWTTPESSGRLPAGGSAGQVLVKDAAADFDASWATKYFVPTGGSTNQVLAKSSATNGALQWITPEKGDTLPAGGAAGTVLTKDSSTNGDWSWKTPTGVLPTGGTTGQLLQKSSSANYAASWVTGYLVPSGGSAGQVLMKDTATAGDVSWGAPTVGNIVNQYNSGSSYVIQFRTTSTYGTGASTFQIRMGTSGTWYTLAKE